MYSEDSQFVSRLQALVTALVLALVQAPVPASETPSSRAVSEQVQVSMRLIDVLATDKKGEPLIGLGPEDFTVLIDGKERSIRTFDAAVSLPSTVQVSEGDPAAGSAKPEGATVMSSSPQGERPGRWVVILLDADRMPHNYRKVVLKTARALITDGGEPGDRFAVALLRDGALQFLQDFAPAKEVDLAVLDDPGRLISRANDLRSRIDELVQLVSGCKETAFPNGCVMTRSEEFLGGIRSENASGFSALSGLLSAMYPLPGRKALIWFSNGFVLRPGEVVHEIVTRYVGELPTLTARLTTRDRPYTEELISQAGRAQVSFFALRAGGDFSHVMRGADTPTLEQPIDRQAGNPYKRATTMSEEVLRDIADGTGGKAIMTPLNPKLAEGLLDRLDGVYTLGIDFQPGDSPRSRLKVKLNRKKSSVQVRKRLSQRGPPAPRLTVTLSEVPAGLPDSVAVMFSVDLDIVRTEKDRDSGVTTSRLACYARLRGPEGTVLDEHYRIYEVLRAAGSEKTFDQSITFDHPPGDYQVEVTVSDLVGRGSTTAVTSLTAPAPRAAN